MAGITENPANSTSVGQSIRIASMNILFLHGWQSTPGGVKPTHLARHGHTVFNPKLPDDDFAAAVSIARSEFDRHQPDVVVGSSRGSAVAMNLNRPNARLVLLCPAWKKWGDARTVPADTILIHSRADEVIPFEHSVELAANSELPSGSLRDIGNDHRLADSEPLDAMLEACEHPFRSKKMAEAETPYSKQTQAGQVAGVVGDVYRFLATGKETGGRYAQIDAIVPPGGGPPPHIHSREAESFFVIEGEITFRVDGQTIVAPAGAFAHMPTGSLHSFRNETNQTARMLITLIPAGLEEMFIEVGQPLPEGATSASTPSPEEIARLLAAAPRYGVEIQAPPPS